MAPQTHKLYIDNCTLIRCYSPSSIGKQGVPMNKLFKNVLFSVTVNQGTDQKASVDDVTSELIHEEQISYNALKRMIEEMGGKVCSTVHKKVDYLVASSSAVNGATQRVRKADKFKVPVLKIQYIRDVYTKTVKPDAVRTYIYSNENLTEKIQAYQGGSISMSSTACKATTSVAQTEKDKEKKNKKNLKKRKVDDTMIIVSSYKAPSFVSSAIFECACICHDRGESSCSWCVSAHSSSSTSDTTAACDDSNTTSAQGEEVQCKDESKEVAVEETLSAGKNKRHKKGRSNDEKKKKLDI